jgi:biopolymer transport protein ExbD
MSRRSITSEMNAATDVVSGINVTPLVDVMLVLLIIFMVTAKMAAPQALPMEFPGESPGREIELAFSVDLRTSGAILVDEKPLSNDESIFAIAKEASAKHKHLRAVIGAESAVPHGRVIRVLDLVKQAGITSIAFGVRTSVPATTAGSLPASTEARP